MNASKEKSMSISVFKRALLIAFIPAALVISGYVSIFYPSNAMAAPQPQTQASCVAAGGSWVNQAPTGGIPSMGCSGVGIAQQQSLDWQVKSLLYYRSIGKCFQQSSNNTIDANKVTSGEWFRNGYVAAGPYLRDTLSDIGDDSVMSCSGDSGKQLVTQALALWGLKPIDVLCGAGLTWKEFPNNSARCTNVAPTSGGFMASSFWGDGTSGGSGAQGSISDKTGSILTYLKNKLYGAKTPELSEAGWYTFYKKVFFQQCDTTEKVTGGSSTEPVGTDSRDVMLTIVSDTGVPTDKWYRIDAGMMNGSNYKSFTTRIDNYPGYGDVNRTCKEVADNINSLSKFYAATIKADPTKAGQTSASGEPAEEAASCGGEVEGVGWILCPVLNAMAGLNDAMWGFVSMLLTVSPLQQEENGTQTMAYTVWSAFRTIANVLLIIVFLIMIFSQLTGSGISNYGIKKTLPRLIIAAIAINTSFLLMQITVDVFNLLGKSIYDIMDTLIPVSAPTVESGWSALIGTILASSAVAGAGALVFTMAPQFALMLLVPIALGGLLGLLAALLTLLLRQALIPILAIVAPIAFIAYLLPNTKTWFDKWKSLLITMLMLFPIAAILFAGVRLASSIFTANGEWWGAMVGLAILTIPLFMLPFLARQAGPMLSKVNGSIRKLGSSVEKPVGAWADRRKALSLARSDASTPGRANLFKRARQGLIAGKERTELATSAAKKRNELLTSAAKAQVEADFNSQLATDATTWSTDPKVAAMGGAAQAFVRNAGVRAEAEEIKQAQIPLQQEVADARSKGIDTDKFLEARARSTTHTTAERNAALQELGATGRSGVLRSLIQDKAFTDKEAVQRAITANAGALAGKAPDLVKNNLGAAFKDVSGEQMAGFSADTAAVHMKYLEDLHTAASAPGATTAQKDDFNHAITSFYGAVSDIQKTPTLQAKLTGDVGVKIREKFSTSADPAFRAYLPPSIQKDGKIR